jgi:hypothetical protein
VEKSKKELRKEGEAITKKLGNGVIYAGPWFKDDRQKIFLYHTFTDDQAFTGTTFTAKDLESAKLKLVEKRKLFGMKLPSF